MPAPVRAPVANRSFLGHKTAAPRARLMRRHLTTMNVLGATAAGASAAVIAAAGLAVRDARRHSSMPAITMIKNDFNSRVVEKCPTLLQEYKPLPFLTNCHVETIFAAWFRNLPGIQYRRECIVTPDKGCVALDWCIQTESQLPPTAPVLILLPGLTGGSDDSYVQHAVERARKAGIRAVVFNSRGTAESPVTTPQFYSASFTDDLRAVVDHVRSKYPAPVPLLAAGWSLGANILVKYLGEEGAATPVTAAVSMCNPFNLTIANANFAKGFNKVYDANLGRGLRRIFNSHAALWAGMPPPFKPEVAANCKTIWEFDDAITIHSFGWPSVEAYYDGSSSSKVLPQVTIPLLCLQALDDPIAPKEAIPYEHFHTNANCILATTPTGGHLGWVAGRGAPLGAPWSDDVAVEFLKAALEELPARDMEAASESALSQEPELKQMPISAT